MSPRYTMTKFLITSLNTRFVMAWKVAGALVSPKLNTRHSYYGNGCTECNLGDILVANANLVIIRHEIQAGEDACTLKTI